MLLHLSPGTKEDTESCRAFFQDLKKKAKAAALSGVFGEERRRMKIVANAFGERAVLKLMYAARIRASESWRGITSNPTRTSPVLRGKWVLEVLLDSPPPPPGVPELPEGDEALRAVEELIDSIRRPPPAGGGDRRGASAMPQHWRTACMVGQHTRYPMEE